MESCLEKLLVNFVRKDLFSLKSEVIHPKHCYRTFIPLLTFQWLISGLDFNVISYVLDPERTEEENEEIERKRQLRAKKRKQQMQRQIEETKVCCDRFVYLDCNVSNIMKVTVKAYFSLAFFTIYTFPRKFEPRPKMWALVFDLI